MNSGLHHVALNVTDVKIAVNFYLKYFAFVEVARPNDRPGAWLQAVDGSQIHLRKAEVPEDNGQHLALLVEDINKTYKSLCDTGIDVTPPKPIGSGLQSFLHDPSGNRLEIHLIA